MCTYMYTCIYMIYIYNKYIYIYRCRCRVTTQLSLFPAAPFTEFAAEGMRSK